MSLHLGATLRILRMGSGLSLRDLAARLGVSSAYLSRVENGVDGVPTVARLAAIARELDVPEELLIDAGHRVSPLVMHYAEEEPQASSLFLEIARRGLGPEELAEVQAFVTRRFPRSQDRTRESGFMLAPLLSPERCVLGMRGDVPDALEVAGSRFASSELPPPRIAAAFVSAFERLPAAIGEGVGVLHITVPHVEPQAALLTFERGNEVGPDGLALSTWVLLVGPKMGPGYLSRIAHVSRLAARGLADALAGLQVASTALQTIADLERIN